jgi:hypothetical protein
MTSYNAPTLHLGALNPVFNSSDFSSDSTALTQGSANSTYLKLSGGTETGLVTFNNGLTSNATITVPTITLIGGGITQTASQIGYPKVFNSAITGGSISNGSASSPSFNTISVGSGVWIISYYHNITCTASITFSQITTGITTSSTGVFSQLTSQSSSVSETLASGNKYISGTYVFRTASSVSLYAPITMTFSTAGTVTDTLGINATRLA